MFGLALVAAVETAAPGKPGHRAFHGPSVAAQGWEDSMPLRAMRGVTFRERSHQRRWW